MSEEIKTSIAPWLTVNDAEKAGEFYKSAFNAAETYRLKDPGGGTVLRLFIRGAEFWLSSDVTDDNDEIDTAIGGNTIRMILTVDDPDIIFKQAIKAGATEIFPVGEDHGWRLGRLADPFGLHWEVGHQI